MGQMLQLRFEAVTAFLIYCSYVVRIRDTIIAILFCKLVFMEADKIANEIAL